jgi:hypothetical protein
MTNDDHHVSPADETLVLTSLEHDQLVGVKKRHIPRRHLKVTELAIFWTLRIYLIFMIIVVAYQVWSAR